MRSAAWAFAQLADPSNLSQPRQSALRRIFTAMTGFPEMVAGPGTFDTGLMKVGRGKILTKGGAEGYQALALLPGACGAGSPAYGITIKISDGDQGKQSRARTTVAVEILRQLGALDAGQLATLGMYTRRAQINWRRLQVGEIRPAFDLKG
jgi:L-asparaginase II